MLHTFWKRWLSKSRRTAPKPSAKSRSRPGLEELEPRWVPAVTPLLSPNQAASLAVAQEVGDNDFRISNMGPDGNGNYSARDAAVAYNPTNNEYLVVWSGDDNTGGLVEDEFEVFAQRVNAATGERVGGRIRVSDMGPNGNPAFDAIQPAVAYNPSANEYLVAWAGDDDTAPLVDNEQEIYGQRLSATGAEVGPNDFRISDMGGLGDSNYRALNPAVAYNSTNNEYLVVWEGNDDQPGLAKFENEIWGQRLDAAGGQLGLNDFRVSDMGPDGDANSGAEEPAVVYNPAANEYLVVWAGDDIAGALVDDEFEIYGQRLLGVSGAETGPNDFRVSDMGPDGTSSTYAAAPAVAYNPTANEYLVVWEGADTLGDEFEIWGQRLGATGAEVGANDFRVSDMGPDGSKDFSAARPAAAYNPAADEYLVVWRGDDNTGPLVNNEFEIYGQRLSALGAEVGANDVRLSDMGPDGNTGFTAFAPAVAYNGVANEYLVVWYGDDNTSPLVNDEVEIFGQRYSAVDPPPIPPPTSPSTVPQITAQAFKRKGVAKVRVRDAATGAQRAILTPFRNFRGRLRLALRDVTGDGASDLIVQALINGKRKKKVFDAVTLAPLPPRLA